eukprot:359555-Chlamydomonas_euryale.AAC.1
MAGLCRLLLLNNLLNKPWAGQTHFSGPHLPPRSAAARKHQSTVPGCWSINPGPPGKDRDGKDARRRSSLSDAE